GLSFLLEKGGYAIDDFGEGRARAEAGEGFEFIDAGDPAHHVFEAGLVSFVVGDEFDGGVAARTLLYELRKFFDGNFFGVADVHNFADGMLRVNQTNERFDGVADIAETPRLFSVAIDADGSIVERGFHEIRQDHAIAPGLSRTYSVEKPHDDDGKLFFLPIRKRKKFVQSLGSSIAPAALCGGAKNQIGVFV